MRQADIERRIERWMEDMEDRQQCELFIINHLTITGINNRLFSQTLNIWIFSVLSPEYMGIFSVVSSMFRYLTSWVNRKY